MPGVSSARSRASLLLLPGGELSSCLKRSRPVAPSLAIVDRASFQRNTCTGERATAVKAALWNEHWFHAKLIVRRCLASDAAPRMPPSGWVRAKGPISWCSTSQQRAPLHGPRQSKLLDTVLGVQL
jgi:hypothetical protein